MNEILRINPVEIGELTSRAPRPPSTSGSFGEVLADAIRSVDGLQHESEAAQSQWAAGEPVDLHDVLIKIEEADLAFRTMMEVRNKLVDAYREVMRMGSGG